MHSRRALLYMPGDDRRKIEKATTLGVDCICMDMEDGVAITRKTEARAVIAQAMKELDFGNVRALHPHQQLWVGLRKIRSRRGARNQPGYDRRAQGRNCRHRSVGQRIYRNRMNSPARWKLGASACWSAWRPPKGS